MAKSKKAPGWTADPAECLRVGEGFRLTDVDASSTPGFRGGKADGKRVLAERAAELDDLQEKLYASSLFGDTRSLLVVLQGTDTSGKGGAVRHAFSGANPQGVHVRAFKAPTPAERRHDFLWRIRRELPKPGIIGVFDRSHYEDVIAHRAKNLSAPEVVEARYGIINDFEEELAASGTTVVKAMLHIDPVEQKTRLARRLRRPDKQWKYNPGDLSDRELWPAFHEAYEVAIRRTATETAPWFVVPADRKWYARIAVQGLVIDALRSLDLDWPDADYDVKAEKRRLART